MLVERNMIHDVVDLIPDSEMSKIYAILNAYLSVDTDETLTAEEKARARAGYMQIKSGDYMTLDDYKNKRGL